MSTKTAVPFARKLLVPTVIYTMFVGGLFLACFQFSLYYMAEEYGFGSTVMGLLNSVQFAFMILFTIPLGKLADKIGNKKVYIFQSLCTTVGCLLLWSRLGGMAGILIGVFLGGAGYGLLALLSTTVVTEAFPENSGRYVSLACVGFSAGSMLGPLAARPIAAATHWSVPFLIVSVLGFIGLVMVFFSEFYRSETIPKVTEDKLPLGEILRNPSLVLIGLGIIIYLGIETATGSFMEAYFSETVGAGALSALALSLYWGMMFPTRLAISAYKGTKYPVILVCIVLSAAAFVAATLMPTQLAKTVCFALVGLFLGPVYPIMMGTGSSSMPGHTGTVTGFLSTCFGIGAGLLPPVVGKLIDLLGYPTTMIIMAALTALLFVVYRTAISTMKKAGRTQGL